MPASHQESPEQPRIAPITPGVGESMSETTLKLVIVSDMHCHSAADESKESFLLAGALRKPVGSHPVEAMLRLLGTSPLLTGVTALIAPGDLANKCNQHGLVQGWSHLQEIADALKTSTIAPVLGNHDVDSRRIASKDPLHIARFLREGFPFADDDLSNGFLGQGFCLVPAGPQLELIMVNTVVDHHDEATAKRGAFKAERLESLRTALSRPRSGRTRVAVMHHHPLLHSDAMVSDADVLETGDAILTLLREAGCQLLVHGHKHVPRLRYHDTPAGRIAIFAVGSFSAILREVGTITRNVFHMVELALPGDDGPLCGEVYTWEWQLGTGWMPATSRSSSIPFRTGFGATTPLNAIAEQLVRLAASDPTLHVFGEAQVLAAAPDVRHLTPAEFARLTTLLKAHSLVVDCGETSGLLLGRLYSSV